MRKALHYYSNRGMESASTYFRQLLYRELGTKGWEQVANALILVEEPYIGRVNGILKKSRVKHIWL